MNYIKRENIPGAIIFALFILSLVLIFMYRARQSERYITQLNNEYPRIQINEKISAIVSNVFHGDPQETRNSPHHVFLILNESLKKQISTGYELRTEMTLDYIIEKGDSLVKNSGDKRFRIYKTTLRDSLSFQFELDYN